MAVTSSKLGVVQETRALLRAYESSQSTWAKQFQEDLEFRNGVQYTESQKQQLEERSQAPVTVNMIHGKVDLAVAMLTSNRPSFRTTGREHSDNRTAKLMSDLLAWVWYVSDAQTSLKTAVNDYYIGGRGVLRVDFDPHADFGKGECFIREEDPLAVYPDPNSRHPRWEDAANIIVYKILTEEQVRSTWPDVELGPEDEYRGSSISRPATERYAIEDQILGPQTEDMEHKHYEVIERFQKVKVPFYRVYETWSGKEQVLNEDEYAEYRALPAYKVESVQGIDFVTEPEEVELMGATLANANVPFEGEAAMFHERRGGLQINTGGEAVEGPTQMVPGPETGAPIEVAGSTREVTRLTRGDLISQGAIIENRFLQWRVRDVLVVGLQKKAETILPCSSYPIVPITAIHNRNPYPQSPVRIVRGIQESINKANSKILAHFSSSTNVKAFVPRGAIDKEQIQLEFSRPGAAIIEYEAEIGNITIAAPIPLPNSAYAYPDKLIAYIDQILGLFPFQQGDTANAPPTHRGTLTLDEFGARRIKSKLDDVEAALTALGRVTIELVQAYYTEQKVVRIVQPNNDIDEIVLNQTTYDELGNVVGMVNDVTVGKYDVIVLAGSTLPSSRYSQLDYYTNLMQVGVIDDVEVLKHTDVVDREGVMKRKSVIAQLQSALQQAEQQIKNLEGDLQTARREAVQDEKKVEVQKFKTELQQIMADLRAASEVAKEKKKLTLTQNGNGNGSNS